MSSRRTPKPRAGYARDHLELWHTGRLSLHAEVVKVLNSCDLVSRCTVIFRELRLNDHLRIVFARNGGAIFSDIEEIFPSLVDSLGTATFFDHLPKFVKDFMPI